MPLYMDYHKHVNATFDELVMAHVLDTEVQHKFGVRYLKWWTNADAGTIYCLIESPDKQSCEAVHRAAHGQVACSIVEVDPAFFNIIMGDGAFVGNGPMLHTNGMIDLGYRTILMVSLYLSVRADIGAINAILSTTIKKYEGRETRWHVGSAIIGVFNNADDALGAGLRIQTLLNAEKHIDYRISISTGQPVTEKSDFFGITIKSARRASTILQPSQIGVSFMTQKLCIDHAIFTDNITRLKVLTIDDDDFLEKWFEATEENLAGGKLSIESITRRMGVSRPQLYRKTVNLSQRSPNELLRDQRMEKAFELLSKGSNTVSEIALSVGYSNASHFAKCFAARFGCSPTNYFRTNS